MENQKFYKLLSKCVVEINNFKEFNLLRIHMHYKYELKVKSVSDFAG